MAFKSQPPKKYNNADITEIQVLIIIWFCNMMAAINYMMVGGATLHCVLLVLYSINSCSKNDDSSRGFCHGFRVFHVVNTTVFIERTLIVIKMTLALGIP
jgi:hypothetical protein